MPLHFEIAFSKLLTSEQKQILKLVSDWGNCSLEQTKIVANLYSEHFAPIAHMEDFLDNLKLFLEAPSPLLTKLIFSLYEKYGFSGGKAQLPTTVNIIGYALTRWTLSEALKKEYLFSVFDSDEKKIDEFLNVKSLGGDSSYVEEYFSVKGGDSTVWVTWSETSDNPFDFVMRNSPEEVYNALALSSWYKTGPVFIFYVDLSARDELKEHLMRPTIFDAGNYSPFKPPDPSFALHGYTDPHNEPPLYHSKRPEAIIKGLHLNWKAHFKCVELK